MNALSSSMQDVPLKGESPHPTVSLESILCTEELQRRPSRPPDYEKENRALVKLVSALADSPSAIFHTLAETIQDITQSDSAGLSLLTRDRKTPHVEGQRFYGPAICGMWNPHVGGGTPRSFGRPCAINRGNAKVRPRNETRRIDEFAPGKHDTPDRLLIPEKLYGRAREIDTLLSTFDRVVAGRRPELVLVSGYSGIGNL